MTGIDSKRVLRAEYSAKPEPELLETTPAVYLMIDGGGDPNDNPDYAAAVSALYALSYGLRAAVREATGDAYTVMPLEGLWWVEDPTAFSSTDRADWRWTVLIRQPDPVSDVDVAAVLAGATARKRLERGPDTRLERLDEGRVAQIMHRGPFSEEPPTIERLHRFIRDSGLTIGGRHHEIYLSDPRRQVAGGARTIIRYPVVAVG